MLEIKREKKFLLLTNVLSALQGAFYLWFGFKSEFSIAVFIMAGFDFLYIPTTLFFKRRGYFHYLIVYSAVILVVTAFFDTKLFNNFSALLCLFIAVMIFPKFKNVLMASYTGIAAIMFVLNDEPIYFLLIHITRALWIFCIYEFVIYEQYNRKPVLLYEDECRILEQFCEGKLQKEIELDGYSESTIRRRIAAAMKRNGVKDIEDLKDLYIQTYKKAE